MIPTKEQLDTFNELFPSVPQEFESYWERANRILLDKITKERHMSSAKDLESALHAADVAHRADLKNLADEFMAARCKVEDDDLLKYRRIKADYAATVLKIRAAAQKE